MAEYGPKPAALSAPELRVERGTLAEARQACRDWHYTGSAGAVQALVYRVLEGGRFIGVVLFGSGCQRLHCRAGVARGEVLELTRVALDAHATPVSRIVAVCLRLVRRDRPAVRAVVSYADPEQGHHGGVYQAGGWAYIGRTSDRWFYLLDGRVVHPRQCYGLFGTAAPKHLERVRKPAKHCYALGLNPADRARLAAQAKPYPKRAAGATASTPATQAGDPGSTPRAALQTPISGAA